MGTLTILRVARRFPGLNRQPELPNLETLLEDEAGKIKDGYHWARWICPTAGALVSLGCFLPLALTVHPLFWIGVGGMAALGAGLGLVFHALARRITPTQLLLRQRCWSLAMRLVSFRNLIGMLPVLSDQAATALEEGAAVYQRVRPALERDRRSRGTTALDDAAAQARRALDDAMAQLLALAELPTPQAQDVEISRGWVRPLLDEMAATAEALDSHERLSIRGQLDAEPRALLAGLQDARAELERLEAAAVELDRELNA